MPTWNNDPRIDKMRSGSAEDPYVFLQEPYKIINQKIILQEYPDIVHKIIIDNFVETKLLNPTVGQFYCDYLNGILFFNSSNEGNTVAPKYYGKGISFMASSRIWLEQSNGEVTKTLEDLIIEITSDNTNFNTDENTRKANELIRINNENTRMAQEIIRQSKINEFIYKGEYNPSTHYKVNNIVSYANSTFICVLESSGNDPTNTTYWALQALAASSTDTNSLTFGGKYKLSFNTSSGNLDIEYVV